jgi:putative CocE/NonD family hydrolase
MGWGVPALWFNTWYDVSIGPNMELFNSARAANTDREASANQYAVVAPVPHCQYARLGPHTMVGDRDMGDTSFDVDSAIYGWFDRWLKGDGKAFPATTPRVRYYLMGANKWQTATQWPPADVQPMRLYLRSAGHANTLNGDGRLTAEAPPAGEAADRYLYDPMNPVQTVGGGDCCNGGIVVPGAMDQRPVEARGDVLVYTSDPLIKPVDVVGFVNAVLKVSSSARDTDFAVKLVDVAPDGTAWIIGDTILRARYRDGFDKPVMMAPGQVYTLRPTPITTAIQFGAGHRIRVEVTSSNFPKFVRNLNTGGPNESESKGVVADNAVHHAGDEQSYIELPVVR